MALSADQRQQIILEMEARGLDAASLVERALLDVDEAIQKNAKSYETTDQSAQKTINTFERLASVQRKLLDLQAASRQANEEMSESIQKVDVGWYKLVVTAIKYKDSLEAVAAASSQMSQAVGKSADDLVRIDVGLNKLIVDSFRHIDVMRKQADAQAAMASGVNSAAGQFGGFASAADMAADRSKKFGYAAMNASYLIQDMQYGIGAVANNVGLMAQSLGNASPWLTRVTAGIGGPAGLGAGIMLAAVGADLLYHNWSKIEAAFGLDSTQKAVNDLKAMNAELEKLQSKTIKTAFDHTDIDNQKKRIDGLTEALSAYQRLASGKTKAEQEAGSRATEAIVEQGGGTDYDSSADRIIRGMQRAVPVSDSVTTQAQRKRLAEQEESLRNAPEHNKEIFQHYADVTRQELLDSIAADQRNQREAFKEILGNAALGKDKDLGFIQGLAENNPDAFSKQGVGPGFLPGITRARVGRVREDQAQANAAKIAKDQAAQKAKADQDEANNVRHEQQMKDEADRAANEDAEDEAQDVTKRNRDAKTIRDRLAREKKAADDKTIAERKKKVDSIDQAFTASAAGMMAQNDLGLAEGLPVARTARQEAQYRATGQRYALPTGVLTDRIDTRIARDLSKSGEDPGLAPDIRRNAAETYYNRRTEAQARTPLPDPSALAGAIGEKQANAMANQSQAQQALTQVLQGFLAQANRMEASTARNAAMANGLLGQQRRGKMNRPTLNVP